MLDSKLRLNPKSKLAQTARKTPTMVFTTQSGGEDLQALGVNVVRVEADPEGRVRISDVLHDLAEQGINRLLVEGGATVADAFLKAGFVDRLEIFTAPMILGNAGRHGTGALALRNLNEAPNFMRVSSRSFGVDRLESYETRP